MSKEEKEAIETLKIISEFGGDNLLCREHRKKIDIVLNLIEKQQKEIEELKKKSYKCEYLEEGAEEIIKNSIGKDKIREKIKELEKETGKGCYIRGEKILVLQELLGE